MTQRGFINSKKLREVPTDDIEAILEEPSSIGHRRSLSADMIQSRVPPRFKSFFSVNLKKTELDRISAVGSRRPSFISFGKGKSIFKKKRQLSKEELPPVANGRPNHSSSDLDNSHSKNSSAKGGRTAAKNQHIAERLKAFESGRFDFEDEICGLDEKGIHDLREELLVANKECSEKIKSLLHQHYPSFILAAKGIRTMDSEMQSLRGLLNRENELLNTVKDIADPHGKFHGAQSGSAEWELSTRRWDDSPEGIRWHEALEKLDAAIAEKRLAEALPLLKQAERTLLPGQKSGLYSQSLSEGKDKKTETQSRQLASRRKRLGEVAGLQAANFPLGSAQQQIATQVLASLSGRAYALRKLLEAHTLQLRKSTNHLLKPQNAGGGADGREVANALSQLVFGAIGEAAEDMTVVFGRDLKELGALFLVWALVETERCAALLKQHAITPFAAAVGLEATLNCCQLALLHATALQTSHSLRLQPRLLRLLWPACDQVLQRRLKRLGEDLRAATAVEVEALATKGLPPGLSLRSWPDLMQIFPSADLLLDELEAIAKALRPLGGPRVREALSKVFTQSFKTYTDSLSSQFWKHSGSSEELPEALMDALEPALEVANSIVEQFLPELGEPLKAKCGDVCDLRKLQAQLDEFQDALLPPDESPILKTNPGFRSPPASSQDSPALPENSGPGEASEEGGSPEGRSDWRAYRLPQSLSAGLEEDVSKLAEEEFSGGGGGEGGGDGPQLLTRKSMTRLGQISGDQNDLHTIGKPAAEQELVRLNAIPVTTYAKGRKQNSQSSDTSNESDLEEMNEDLSD